MRPIWQIDADDVERLQRRDPDFVRYMNDLLAQQAAIGRLKVPGDLRSNLKVESPDGGIDAAVDRAMVADATGYFDVPTCWQYKACSSSSIKPSNKKKGGQEAALREEIRKPEAAKLVAAGYGYRLAIADDLTPPLQAKWENWLLDEAKKINPDAKPPKVVAASALATWASRFPGMALPFRPFLGPFKSLRTWETDITSLTPKFVPVAAWTGSMAVLADHANLTRPCQRVVLTVQGEAGVGKTRCVYESLVRPENHALVIYTGNEVEAEKVAEILSNDHQLSAILVADECSVAYRVRLERQLQPHAHRIRVVAIDNRMQDEPTGFGTIRLEQMMPQEVEQLLESRYPELPRGQTRAFAQLAMGFVRLALDLCAKAELIPPEGHLGQVLEFFRDHYLRAPRLKEDEQKAVEVVALLPKVGYKADIRQQLDSLCSAVGCQRDQVLETAVRIKQAPGFIAIGERYLYVTPQIIRQAAFQLAWARWIAPDPDRFFTHKLPSEFMDLFAEQVKACGSSHMREVFSRFFRALTNRLAVSDLADEKTVRRLVRLVEAEPSTLLPSLRRLIESASTDELRRLHARYDGEGRDLDLMVRSSGAQAARRELVWLAEKMLRLPEHFADAERILLRLALAETEGYANNATVVWKEIYRPFLSGTPIPFADRLRLLEQRFQTAEPSQLELCLAALSESLRETGISRLLGPPIVAGRIPPPDWLPETAQEKRECWTARVDLIKRLARATNRHVQEGILDVTIGCLVRLLRLGFLNDLVEIVGSNPLVDVRLTALVQQLDQFFRLYCQPEARGVSAEMEAAIRSWRDRLVPQSLHGRLVALVGKDPWDLPDREANRREVLVPLGRELLADVNVLDRELTWLCSREARSAVLLGEVVGQLDEQAIHLEHTLRKAAATDYPGFARGYLRGILKEHPECLKRTNALLDELQPAYPRAVLDFVSYGPEALNPLHRLLAMVDAGLLPVQYLRGANYSVGQRGLTASELQAVSERLLAAAQGGNAEAGQAAVHVWWTHVSRIMEPSRPMMPLDRETQQHLRCLLEVTLPTVGKEEHAWLALLKHLGDLDPHTAIGLAVAAATSDDHSLAHEMVPFMAAMASNHAGEVMTRLGMALLDTTTGWRLSSARLGRVLEAIRFEVVVPWLEEHGQPAAQAIARHLPPPYLDAAGNPLVPQLTAYVLEHYGSDEVCSAFCVGVHDGQIYEGNIAAQHEQEAEIARHFLDHPLPGIRQWADYEIARGMADAALWRARDEEMSLH